MQIGLRPFRLYTFSSIIHESRASIDRSYKSLAPLRGTVKKKSGFAEISMTALVFTTLLRAIELTFILRNLEKNRTKERMQDTGRGR